MRLSKNYANPCTVTTLKHVTLTCKIINYPSTYKCMKLKCNDAQVRFDKWDPLPLGSINNSVRPDRLGRRWMEYQGIMDWEGLLDPLDDKLRKEIIRYGYFVDAAYRAFDFDTSSPSYATCKYKRGCLLDRSGLSDTGYRVTRNLYATSKIQIPRWINNVPSWVATQSSWIGYVAVCEDQKEIARLGRRDILISFRGTATCMEWLENLCATLSHIPSMGHHIVSDQEKPMVESGFLSLYNSSIDTTQSLQQSVRDEIRRLIRSYGDEPISLTVTGHSLGAALAILTAYDIKTTFVQAPPVTVFSFGGPRVGNRSFCHNLEKHGVKVLRIVNSDDIITKVPGFVIENMGQDGESRSGERFPLGWIERYVKNSRWLYAEVGRELRLRSRDSPELAGIDVATCHDLKTYLHLVNGFVSSTCPFTDTARKIIKRKIRS